MDCKEEKVNKNIWILNHYAKTPDMSGGTRHYDLGKELAEKGYNVTIFASGFDNNKKKYIKIKPEEKSKIEEYNGIKLVWINTIPYYKNDWKRILNMLSYIVRVLAISKKIENPDIIIGSSVHPFAVIAAWWLARRYKARFIFEVRDLWPQTPVDMGIIKANSVMARLLYAWEKFMYKRAEKIITLLPNAKDYITNLGIDSEKVIWIPNGVNLNNYNNNYNNYDDSLKNTKIYNEIKRNENKFKIIYAGAHGIPNGLDVIIDAISLIDKRESGIHFIFIGEGTEKPRLIEKSKMLELKNIGFYDSIPKYFVPSVLALAESLIVSIPNFKIYQYGVSLNKLFDYFASGKPVIMIGNPKNNIVRDANAGLTVEAENPAALAEAIIKIKNMTPEERKSLGENGRKYVEKYYSTKVLVNKLESIL